MGKITQEIFNQRCSKTQEGKGYEIISPYIGAHQKITVKCPKHGEWNIRADHFQKGVGCKKCAAEKCSEDYFLTHDEFVKRVDNLFEGKIKIISDYNGHSEKVTIECQDHGQSEVIATNLLYSKNGCRQCWIKNSKLSNEEFLKRFYEKHDPTMYSVVSNYTHSDEKMKFHCKKHGPFQMKSHIILKTPFCCPKCGNESKAITPNEFLKRMNEIHFNKNYTVDLNKVGPDKVFIDVCCPSHGPFISRRSNFLIGSGCPVCKSSKGEMMIFKFLTENGYKFEYQKSYSDLKFKGKLKFDFCVFSNKDKLIEYQGYQHYNSVKYFGGEEILKLQQFRDNLKRIYCQKKNIPLLEIKYDNLNWKQDILEFLS